MVENLKKLKQWYLNYAQGFLGKETAIDSNIIMKRGHTLRVCAESKYIAKSINLNSQDCILAEVIALLHDLGRFEQYVKYRTFSDFDSEDHAQMSLNIAKRESLLDFLAEIDVKIVMEAIANHNRKHIQISDSLGKRGELHAKIIRDADKIDIYKVVIASYLAYIEAPEKFDLAIGFGEADTDDYTEAVFQDVMHARKTDYNSLKTINDRKLLQLGWIYDINFNCALKRVIERGYIDTILQHLPSDENMGLVRQTVAGYIDARLNVNEHDRDALDIISKQA